MTIPITNGQGQSSVATEVVGTFHYQQIKVIGGEPGSTSVMGVNPDRSINVSVIGTVQMSGSVVAAGNQSVSGTVGASVIGWVPIQPSNTSIIAVVQNSSFIGVVTGSIVSIPTGNQSVSGDVGASVIGWVPIQASNTSVLTIWQSASIAGTYSDDAAHGQGARGLGILAVRNDNVTSVTSATNDYSHFAVGPAGETLVADAPYTKWVSGVADLRVVLGASVTAIPAQGASVFTYVREVQVANFGSASVLVKIAGGLGSTLGWTIAPAGGGSNFTTRYKTGENSAVTASINGTASVLVTIAGFTAGI